MKTLKSMCRAAAALACFATVGAAQTVLFDTGVTTPVLFNGTATNLGWTSGDAGTGLTQRWTPQPLTLPAGDWIVTQFVPQFFIPTGLGDPTDLGWVVWTRNGDLAPTQADEVASGAVPYSGNPADPITLNLPLTGGDYYITVYGIGNVIGWFTNAPTGIPFLDGSGLPWMWRSATYPSPGFAFYQLPAATLAPVAGGDPNTLYTAGFTLLGEPAPVTYCTSGISNSGCVAAISYSGLPSVSATTGFSLLVSNVEGQRAGRFFYGLSGRSAVLWNASGTAYLCVNAPRQRTPLQFSGGTAGGCDGSGALDWQNFLATHPNALGNPFAAGVTVDAQFWYRDPPAVKSPSNLSDALEFTTLP